MTSEGNKFTSWASVSEAFVMMMMIACEGRPTRLLDYTQFLTQMTAKACETAWPVILYYIEKSREDVLPRKPSGSASSEAEAIAASQERRDSHKLFRELSALDLIEIYQKITRRPEDVAARLNVQLSTLRASMPELQGPVRGPAGAPYQEGFGGAAPATQRNRVSTEVVQWCRSAKACMRFQTGTCTKDPCDFAHIQCPKEVSGLGSASRGEKRDKKLTSGAPVNKST